MKKLFTLLVLIAAVIALGVILSPGDDATTTPNENTTQTYHNSVYGYSLIYPRDLQLEEYSPDNASFGSTAEVRVVSITGTPGTQFIDAVTEHMSMLCAADGPQTSFNCTGAGQVQPFTSDSDVQGFTFYLNGELRNLADNSTTAVGKGPYFAFPLKSSAAGSLVLVVHPPLNQSAGEADSSLIRSIAETVQVDPAAVATEPDVEQYVKANISTLSPVKAELGGTFYVTDIRTANGMGTVEYEDGHIALTADFNYTVDADGSVNVTNFVVREDVE